MLAERSNPKQGAAIEGSIYREALGALAVVVLCAAGCDRAAPVNRAAQASGGDAAAGRVLIRQVGCVACHDIPGVQGPRGRVGPSLAGFAGRALIAGRTPNQPQALAQFVRDASAFDPQTGMPPMPLDEDQARDVAAYLYTLDGR